MTGRRHQSDPGRDLGFTLDEFQDVGLCEWNQSGDHLISLLWFSSMNPLPVGQWSEVAGFRKCWSHVRTADPTDVINMQVSEGAHIYRVGGYTGGIETFKQQALALRQEGPRGRAHAGIDETGCPRDPHQEAAERDAPARALEESRVRLSVWVPLIVGHSGEQLVQIAEYASGVDEWRDLCVAKSKTNDVAHSISRSFFDDAEVPLSSIAERAECFLVARALVGSDSLLGTLELDHDGALCDPRLVNPYR
jgi:hypothetical protein